jgi:hypothetical protein
MLYYFWILDLFYYFWILDLFSNHIKGHRRHRDRFHCIIFHVRHNVQRSRPSCPLRNEEWQGAEKTGATMQQGLKACCSTQFIDGLRWMIDHYCIDAGIRRLLFSSPTDYALLHRRRTSTASHQRSDGLRWTIDHC